MKGLLQGYVDRQAELRPDALALVAANERLTYGELASASNRLARLLKDAGCLPGERVCFLMPKTPVAIVAMVGILKADCVYVPLDAAGPAPRLARVVDACEPRWILASGPVASLLDDVLRARQRDETLSIGWLDAERVTGERFQAVFSRSDMASYPDGVPVYSRSGEELAHILFTSGSTGQPKGVMITHANVRSFITWAVDYFGISARDRVSGHSPLHFDLSSFDIYGAFAAGAALHLVPPELNLLAPRLADFIRTSQLTQWFSVPSVLRYMARFDAVAPGDFPSLERLMWCGEVFPSPPLRYWMERLPHVTFTNLYGPTEATIASSYHTLPACPESDSQAIPIGAPCEGEELLVLDETGRRVPPGVIGDLYIAGVGLSPGYWRDPETTGAAFRPHPDGPGTRLYRTGDLASIGADGLVYFHGRADSQIKSRGHRIELGEIETAVNAMSDIRECAVVAVPSAGFEGTTICCAYVPEAGRETTPASIRAALGKVVPAYMLPGRWRQFEHLPTNVNGKIDRPALRRLFQEQS